MSNLKYKKYDRFCQLGPKDDGRPPMSCLRPNDCNSTSVIEQYERKTWRGSRPYIYDYKRNNDRNCIEEFSPGALMGLLPDEKFTPSGGRMGEECQWNNQCRSGKCDVRGGHGICTGTHLSNEKGKSCTRPCRKDECPGQGNEKLNNECGHDARYLCTKGKSEGGCTGSETLWKTSTDCSDCCDRWHENSCNECSEECTQEECHKSKCNPDINPWACTEGKAEGGCAENQQSWSMGMRAPGEKQCNKCCDSSKCN